MTYPLSLQNLSEYLVTRSLCPQSQQNQLQIEPVAAKNFNLLVTFPDERKLLIKQERYNQEGKTAGEFLNEWRIQEFLQQFPETESIRPWLPIVLHFDAEHSIIIFNYLKDYRDLAEFYTKENSFPEEIASSLGTVLGSIHRATFNHQGYRDFFSQNRDRQLSNQVPNLIQGLERISPEIFGLVPMDGLKFFALYQRYDSLGQAIAELGSAFTPTCLTHNDLKLNNILLHTNWNQTHNSLVQEGRSQGSMYSQFSELFQLDSDLNQTALVRLIDWERSHWGDPAFDLGTLIASYIQIWLNSLVISQALTIEESLRLATTPLDQIQPSIATLTLAYFYTFPEILQHRPDYLQRVVQFAGLALIQQIQAMIQYQKSFGNAGICMLQVAKSLLCRPAQSIPTIFGTTAAELIPISSLSAVK